MAPGPARCKTCEDLLAGLSAASERVFRITSELTSAVLAGETAGVVELLMRVRTLRSACDQIRTRLEEHWARSHRGRMAMTG